MYLNPSRWLGLGRFFQENFDEYWELKDIRPLYSGIASLSSIRCADPVGMGEFVYTPWLSNGASAAGEDMFLRSIVFFKDVSPSVLLRIGLCGVTGSKSVGHMRGPLSIRAFRRGNNSLSPGRARALRLRQDKIRSSSSLGSDGRKRRTGTGSSVNCGNGFLGVPSPNGRSPVSML